MMLLAGRTHILLFYKTYLIWSVTRSALKSTAVIGVSSNHTSLAADYTLKPSQRIYDSSHSGNRSTEDNDTTANK
jgi:hypothetical protein